MNTSSRSSQLVQLLASLVICLHIVSTTQAQAQLNPENFYQKIRGLYQDKKTNEVVFVSHDHEFFYQPNPYCLNNQVKTMKERSLDIKQKRLQVQFTKSTYRCTFIFAANFQSFICINPDGSRQTFQRVDQVIHKPFAYFLALFPTHTGKQYRVLPKPAYSKQLPLQIAYEFIMRTYDPYNLKKSRLYRLFLSTPQATKWHYMGKNTLYAVKRLYLNPNFYSLLIHQRGVGKSGEATYDMTELCNFDSSGKQLGSLVVGRILIGFKSHESHITSIIKGSQIKVQDKDYNGLYSKNKTPKVQTSFYTLLPNGKFKLKE